MGGASSERQVHVFGGRSNDYSDGTDDRLIRLEELGWVHHRHNEIAPGIKPQPSALKRAQDDPFVSNSDWAMVFDADEFLCIKYGDRTLGDMIARASGKQIALGNRLIGGW